MGTMHTPLESLQIVSVGSLRHQVPTTRMVHDECKKGPAGKMMYADQGPRENRPFRYGFICLQLAEILF